MHEEQFVNFVVSCAILAVTAYIANSLRLLKRQATSVIAVVNCIFFAVYILPMGLDLFIRNPDFGHLVGYNRAANDSLVRIYSAIALSIAPIIWTQFAKFGYRPRSEIQAELESRPNRRLFRMKNAALIAIAVSPILFLAFAPSFEPYASYGPILSKVSRSAIEELSFHAYLNQLIIYSMLSSFILLITLLRSRGTIRLLGVLLILGLLLIDCYLHGKRSSVAIVFCSLVFCIWYTNSVRMSLLVPFLTGSVIIVAGFSLWYQDSFGRSQSNTFEKIYNEYRLEFSRDHAHKFVLYNGFHADDDTRILSYPGESLVIYLTLPIPRSIWQEKPVSYAMSLTCAALGVKRHYLGWGVTSSILDESIANFGLFGIFLGPLAFGVILRNCLRYNDAVFRMVTTVLCLMLMMVHLSSCLPMLLCWILILWNRRRRRAANRVRVA